MMNKIVPVCSLKKFIYLSSSVFSQRNVCVAAQVHYCLSIVATDNCACLCVTQQTSNLHTHTEEIHCLHPRLRRQLIRFFIFSVTQLANGPSLLVSMQAEIWKRSPRSWWLGRMNGRHGRACWAPSLPHQQIAPSWLKCIITAAVHVLLLTGSVMLLRRPSGVSQKDVSRKLLPRVAIMVHCQKNKLPKWWSWLTMPFSLIYFLQQLSVFLSSPQLYLLYFASLPASWIHDSPLPHFVFCWNGSTLSWVCTQSWIALGYRNPLTNSTWGTYASLCVWGMRGCKRSVPSGLWESLCSQHAFGSESPYIIVPSRSLHLLSSSAGKFTAPPPITTQCYMS